jgi:hypothetical protein
MPLGATEGDAMTAEITDPPVRRLVGAINDRGAFFDARSLRATFENDTWRAMRTAWRFDVTEEGRVGRFETGPGLGA